MMPSNSKLKKQKISEEESSSPSEVDIISSLPDSVLSHIVSFLPTQEAVKTSILSKRWRYVWTCVDKLKFDTTYLRAKARKQLPRFVYNVLKSNQGKIKGFTLSGGVGREYNEFDVVSWINTVISRGVERLHVEISFQDGFPKWPLSIFGCKTLVDLKIWRFDVISMNVPTTPIFPCLKKLEVSCCESGFFKHIVSRCLALEHLIVRLSETAVHIVSSSVKRLELCTKLINDEKVFLCVPSLQYLKFHGQLPLEFIVKEQLSSLIEADISFIDHTGRYYSQNVNAKEMRDSFVRFIQPISNVKLLRIKFFCNKFFNSVGHGLFVNLTKLEIISEFFEWRLLLCFMENSNNLEAISLRKTSTLKKHKLVWKEPKKAPTSLSSSLKKLSIHEYSEEELPMVRYVLRTAQILELVDIHWVFCYRDFMNNDWKSDMLQNSKKLQNLDRACDRCKVTLREAIWY